MNRRDVVTLGLASAATALAPLPAFAQAWPTRPIKLMVPFSAGGVTDIVGRHWADRMKTPIGTVYVENQGGAGGTIAASEVARSQPDGHTIMLGNTSIIVLNPMTMAKLPYDADKDFTPIAMICVAATAIVIHSSVPAKNLKEFIVYAKANQGKMSYGTAGAGTMTHLAGELFKQLIGAPQIVQVPYKGAGPGLTDLAGGHIPMMTPNVTSQVLELHRNGTVRILAVNAPERLKGAPEIPTAVEEGLPGMIGQLFVGLFAPAATPKQVVERIAAATQATLATPDFQKILLDSGLEPSPDTTPDKAKRYVDEEVARWGPVVKASGFKVE
jgi:tripartite-type tricarboxylate transporter receptor subunit TctC